MIRSTGSYYHALPLRHVNMRVVDGQYLRQCADRCIAYDAPSECRTFRVCRSWRSFSRSLALREQKCNETFSTNIAPTVQC